MRAQWILWLLLVGAAGCTFSDGGPFAELESTILEARLIEAPGRGAGDGWQRLNTDYQARFDVFVLDTAGLTLQRTQAGSGGGGGGTFDPANPPPRYSNCHSGHCHRDDGALVDFEDIQAEMDGGGGGPTVVSVVSFRGESLDLVEGTRRSLICAECDLPEGGASQLRMPLTRLLLRGAIRDGRTEERLAGEVPFSLDLTFTEEEQAVVAASLDLPADRSQPPRVSLELSLELTSALVDNVDWAALAKNADGISLGEDANSDARALILQQLMEIEMATKISRTSD
ncbi:hypothetical protein [Myxococcus sp. AB036A]|uniref:hypothetical protein n=1 Tax=Myxococcus sp. AB036A TaxID=2562793 RepID=UPI0011462F04|nr:hypothetical protein [Myxococcus sp. AB036A]